MLMLIYFIKVLLYNLLSNIYTILLEPYNRKINVVFPVIPPTPAKEDNKDNKFDFTKTLPRMDSSENARSVENLYRINRLENPQKGAELLFVSKLSDSRRLSIPVVLIPADGKIDSSFDTSDHVYRENLFKAASVSSLGNFGNIAAEPMPIIKNKEGKW